MKKILYVGKLTDVQTVIDLSDFDSVWFVYVDEAGDYVNYYKGREGKVDLVVTDDSVETPNDGLQFARRLHQVCQPVLVLSDWPIKGVPVYSKSMASVDDKALLAKIMEVMG